MQITPRIALEVLTHEAIVRQAYKDSVGVWTWSVGLTRASGHNVERYIDNPQPMEKCLEVFIWALRKYAADVLEVFSGHELTEAQFGAALSFHWNTGAIKKASWVKHWKKGSPAKAKKAFMNWSKPSSIIPRRKAERDLFFDGKWSGDGRVVEWTRVTAKHTPDWRSGKQVDVSEEIKRLLAPSFVRPDVEPPDAPKGKSGGAGPVTALAALVAALVAGLAAKGCDWLGLFCN